MIGALALVISGAGAASASDPGGPAEHSQARSGDADQHVPDEAEGAPPADEERGQQAEARSGNADDRMADEAHDHMADEAHDDESDSDESAADDHRGDAASERPAQAQDAGPPETPGDADEGDDHGAASSSRPDRDGTIHQSLPIAASSFQSEGDCGDITAGTAWHFVLNHTTVDTDGSTLTATFEDAGTETVGVSKIAGGTTHYFVGTADGDVLTGASVSTGDGQLQLSHVCDADGQSGEGADDGDDDANGDDDTDVGGDQGSERITICHATGSETNPYVVITISKQGVLNGHEGDWHQDGEDIIPAFDGFEGQPVGQGPVTESDCPAGDVDDGEEPGDGDTTVAFSDVTVVCTGATPTQILFELESDELVGSGTVSLTDADDAALASTTVTFEDGEASGSLAYPTSFEGPLVLSVTFDGAGGTEDVPAVICTVVGDDDEEQQPTAPIPGIDVGGDDEEQLPAAPMPGIDVGGDDEEQLPAAPMPGIDVEGDEVTNVPQPQPAVTPVFEPTVDRGPAVLGDTVTRSVRGQLPRTGTDSTSALAPFGAALLLAGFALQRSGRRMRRSA